MFSLLTLATLLGSALASVVPSNDVSYDGYKVLRIANVKDIGRVARVVEKLDLDTWKFPKTPGANVDVVVPPAKLAEFKKLTAGLSLETMHDNLGASIADEAKFGAYEAGTANTTWFQSYHSYEDHLQFLRDIQKQNPTSSEVITIGNSHEGRPIYAIHIWGSAGKGVKPAAVFHGTIHAREWITTMVNEYFIWQLFADSAGQALRDRFDFYIFTVANPDGFVYTQRDRMWRKNRQPGGSCVGTDLNRNYPYQWSGSGSSTDPCNETYRGASAGNTPEIRAHTSFMQRIASSAQGLKIFVDWHAYSQLFMTPYGYSCSARAPNDALHQRLASAFASALRAVHGTAFRTGPICTTIYQANGNSADWAVGAIRGETAFAAELRDTGRYGFVLPANQIIPSGQETWAGLKALMNGL